MDKKELSLKVLYNKTNNQCFVPLPRKILGLDKKQIPKRILLDIKELEYLE